MFTLSMGQTTSAQRLEVSLDNRPVAYPHIKVCGLTRPDEAQACAEAGAHAIGLVFYPPSPRYVTDATARDITEALPDRVVPVGVFVDESYGDVMKRVVRCGLKAVQLHGNESPEMVDRLMREDVYVIKTLFHGKSPALAHAARFRPCAYLAECGGGKLPGGNARTWDWRLAKTIGREYPVILAGGLSPDNVGEALAIARPDAVDVSSGVESSPGRKDIHKVQAFVGCIAARTGSENFQRQRSVFE